MASSTPPPAAGSASPPQSPSARVGVLQPSISAVKTTSAGVVHDVDLLPLGGLRGLLALHIALFHYMLYSDLRWDIQGSPQMPWFFLLSGFTMAVVYGAAPLAPGVECGPFRVSCCAAKRPAPHTSTGPCWHCPSGGGRVDGSGAVLWDMRAFWRNRCARVAPLYYILSLAGGVMTGVGHGLVQPTTTTMLLSAASNATFTTTLLAFAAGLNLNVPAWTVCTLAVFWLFLPCLLRRAQAMPVDAIPGALTAHFWYQALAVGLAFVAIAVVVPGSAGLVAAFAISTQHPLLRLSLFYMGILAGTLRLAHARTREVSQRLWTRASCCSCCQCTRNGRCGWAIRPAAFPAPETPQAWGSLVDRSAAAMAVLYVAVVAFGIATGSETYGNTWLQVVVPFAQLSVMVGVTHDGGASWFGTALRSRPLQFLGRISLSLYLLHFPLMNATTLALSGPVTNWPAGLLECDATFPDDPARRSQCDRESQEWLDAKLLPGWAIAPLLLVALLVAAGLHFAVEAPLRTWLHASTPVVPRGAGGEGDIEMAGGGGLLPGTLVDVPSDLSLGPGTGSKGGRKYAAAPGAGEAGEVEGGPLAPGGVRDGTGATVVGPGTGSLEAGGGVTPTSEAGGSSDPLFGPAGVGHIVLPRAPPTAGVRLSTITSTGSEDRTSSTVATPSLSLTEGKQSGGVTQ